MIPTPSERWSLPTHTRIGKEVWLYQQIDSTNSLALTLTEENHNGLAILADQQIAGRGRHGRKWLAPPRSSILLSVIFHTPVTVFHPAILTAWAGVSLCAFVERHVSGPCQLKWPNDVLIDGKKISGILIEQVRVGNRLISVIGIGLNIVQSTEDFQKADLPMATSLRLQGGQVTDSHQLTRELLNVMDLEMTALLADQRESLEERWRNRFGLINKQVEMETSERLITGFVRRMTFEGILLEQPGGSIETTPTTRVLHLRCME